MLREAVRGSMTPELYLGFPKLFFIYNIIEVISISQKISQAVTAMAAIHCTYRRCAVGADFSDLCQNLVRQMPFMLNPQFLYNK